MIMNLDQTKRLFSGLADMAELCEKAKDSADGPPFGFRWFIQQFEAAVESNIPAALKMLEDVTHPEARFVAADLDSEEFVRVEVASIPDHPVVLVYPRHIEVVDRLDLFAKETLGTITRLEKAGVTFSIKQSE